ncbi:hypothetical protein BGX38DRAFT_348830 [Terfezia claveryi]|nr:hypothetical protein BGX38DRAFT_348830 [Terfezia claveryi]
MEWTGNRSILIILLYNINVASGEHWIGVSRWLYCSILKWYLGSLLYIFFIDFCSMLYTQSGLCTFHLLTLSFLLLLCYIFFFSFPFFSFLA